MWTSRSQPFRCWAVWPTPRRSSQSRCLSESLILGTTVRGRARWSSRVYTIELQTLLEMTRSRHYVSPCSLPGSSSPPSFNVEGGYGALATTLRTGFPLKRTSELRDRPMLGVLPNSACSWRRFSSNGTLDCDQAGKAPRLMRGPLDGEGGL